MHRDSGPVTCGDYDTDRDQLIIDEGDGFQRFQSGKNQPKL